MPFDGVDLTFQISQIQMQWIYPQEEHGWLRRKITSREGTAINPQKEGLVHQQDKGKSLNVSIVTSWVTLKEIVDSP
jgi:hypothetical protein